MAKIDQVVKKFVEIRTNLDEKRKEFKEFEKDQKFKLDRLVMWLKQRADKDGVNSFATDYGTAYKKNKTYVRVGDWDKILAYIRKTKNWQMLEKRIGKIATIEIMEDTGEIPPGVEYVEEIDFQVNKPRKPKR